jgi:hypothetical protein
MLVYILKTTAQGKLFFSSKYDSSRDVSGALVKGGSVVTYPTFQKLLEGCKSLDAVTLEFIKSHAYILDVTGPVLVYDSCTKERYIIPEKCKYSKDIRVTSHGCNDPQCDYTNCVVCSDVGCTTGCDHYDYELKIHKIHKCEIHLPSDPECTADCYFLHDISLF